MTENIYYFARAEMAAVQLTELHATLNVMMMMMMTTMTIRQNDDDENYRQQLTRYHDR